MGRIPVRGAVLSACLALAAGVTLGGVGGLPAALAAPSNEDSEAKQNTKAERAIKRQASRGTRQARPPQFQVGMQLVEKGKFLEARASFELAQRLAPTQPDVLNMLAYTQRKTGALDLAITNYKAAIRQRPDFPQAREYLGEAYLQAALRELTALERAGTSAESQHASLLRTLHDVAGELPPRPDAKQNAW